MEEGLLMALVIGFLLGIKHAIEPDHIIAVSTIASESKRLSRSSLAGVFWGVGHTLTLLVVGMIFISFEKEIPESWALSLEFLVGVMIVFLGFRVMFAYKDKDDHSYRKNNRSYYHSLIIGFIHGMAGSGTLILLTMSTVKQPWEAGIFILMFGGGTILGMLLCTTLIGVPFVISKHIGKLNKRLIQLTGIGSMIYGVYYMYNLGVSGLFEVWL